MIFINSQNIGKVLSFLPKIRSRYLDWHFITLEFKSSNKDLTQRYLEMFMDEFAVTEGFSYFVTAKKAVCVMNLGKITNYNEIYKNLNHEISTSTEKEMDSFLLKQIQIDLSIGEGGRDPSFFNAREKRDENVILIAEDDMFIRQILTTLLQDIATVHVVETGDMVVSKYKEINPDVLLLDIHLPNVNGLDILTQLNEVDSSAFVLVLSADSIKENILGAIKSGAIGFLAKPIQKEKLFSYLKGCTTFNM